MCGLVGVFSKKNKNIIPKTIFALEKLQHRGQEAAGVCFFENELKLIKNTGLVKDILKNIENSSKYAIGHVRYSTKGDNSIKNAQPFLFKNVALAHNGTIFEIEKFRNILIKNGFGFKSNSDSEVVLKWLFYKINKNPDLWTLDEIQKVLFEFKNCAYCILLLFENRIIAFNDPNNYHPLIFFETEEEYLITSEDWFLKENYIKKIEIKSAIEINQEGYKLFDEIKKEKKHCVFEAVYFSHPKSNIFNFNVKKTRFELGKILAKNDEIRADYVVPIMKSGFWGAVGYSKEKNIKLKILIKNNSQILRTFIEKKQIREKKLDEKFIIKKEVKNKDIILVDDSIVRGNTSKKIISLLKQAGVGKIHLRLTSPMIKHPCFWGVDIPCQNELLAYKLKTIDNIKQELGVDSVKFLSNFEFEKVFNKDSWCHNCFLE